MLGEEVVQAVRKGRFSLWAVGTIDEGIAVLTGTAAGDRGPDGSFPPESIYGRVEDRFRQLAEAVREYLPGLDGSPVSARRPSAPPRRGRLQR
jgi:hypothetical protein